MIRLNDIINQTIFQFLPYYDTKLLAVTYTQNDNMQNMPFWMLKSTCFDTQNAIINNGTNLY